MCAHTLFNLSLPRSLSRDLPHPLRSRPPYSARATAAEIARIHQLDDDALARVGQDRETLVNGAVDRYLAG